jgi:hypothetical protein
MNADRKSNRPRMGHSHFYFITTINSSLQRILQWAHRSASPQADEHSLKSAERLDYVFQVYGETWLSGYLRILLTMRISEQDTSNRVWLIVYYRKI